MRYTPARPWVTLVLLVLCFSAVSALGDDAAPAAPPPPAAPPLAAEPMFDDLAGRADVIYLMANSSLVFGPDPHARSEEITFAGLVTVPKYPMAGYDRRRLGDGRQQIDIELTSSELTGESYLLGGTVKLGEHPDLRSIGTITQSPTRAARLGGASEIQLAANRQVSQASAAPPNGGRAKIDVTVVPRAAELIARNPDILWDELLEAELRKLAAQAPDVRRNAKKVIPATVTATKVTFSLTPRAAADVRSLPPGQRDDYLSQIVDSIINNLTARRLVTTTIEEVNLRPPVIPNDFVVARKVLITTAKGILYNETPVPVRGTIDSIPPVRRPSTPEGVNVFKGMELPVPLLDADGNVDGWFYSKAHMAYAVLPDAIQRNEIKGTVTLRNNGKEEQVAFHGPMEIHFREAGRNAAGQRQTEIEVMVLALRGKSEIFGGDVMMIEAFSDRDHFSKGMVTWADGKPSPLRLDLYTQIYTPAGKLDNPEPIRFEGTIAGLKDDPPIERGTLRIPLYSAVAGSAIRSTKGSDLLDESGQSTAQLTSMSMQLEDLVVR